MANIYKAGAGWMSQWSEGERGVSTEMMGTLREYLLLRIVTDKPDK